MSLFERWTRFRRFRLHPDTFTMTASRKRETLVEWVQRQRSNDVRTLVVTHFQSTFLDVQQALDQAGIDSQVLARRVTAGKLAEAVGSGGGTLHLTLAPMLVPTIDKPARKRQTGFDAPSSPLALIVAERHPLPARDEAIVEFARQLDCPVAAAWLLSFDDPVLRYYLGERFIGLMRMLGMGDNDLVSSAMTARNVRRAMRKSAPRVHDERAAESPGEWLAANFRS